MGKKQRGSGEGSIRKRPDGRYEARYSNGRSSEGKQQQRSIYGKTRSEVSKKLTEAISSINKGQYVEPNKKTLGEWLDTWLEKYVAKSVRRTTYLSYEGYIHNHINPKIGDVKLSDLSAYQLQMFYEKQSEDGNIKNKSGLSPKTLRNVNNMLHKALAQACKNELITKNVSENVVLPKREKKEISVLSVNEQAKLVNILNSERLGFAILLDLYTGLRIGELCALRWSDIDFTNRSLKVCKTMQRIQVKGSEQKKDGHKTELDETPVKTDNSYREIPIQDKVFDEMMKYLERQNQEKSLAGTAYNDKDYIFSSPIGGAIEPSVMRDVFNRLLFAAEIEHKCFHSLRHTFATRAIESGVQIKTASDILGHATVQITMDYYCHPSMDLKRAAVNKMADFL